MTENHRKFPREEIHIEVELSFLDDEPHTAITHDLSLGGLFIQLKDPDHYPLGDMVSVRYKDPLNDYEATFKDAVIVRCTDDGIAVAFVEMEEF